MSRVGMQGVNVTCKAVAELIKGKTPDEIKAVFDQFGHGLGVEGDVTEEEKAQVRRHVQFQRTTVIERKTILAPKSCSLTL